MPHACATRCAHCLPSLSHSSLPLHVPAGFYTYFASEAVSYGANPSNWPELGRSVESRQGGGGTRAAPAAAGVCPAAAGGVQRRAVLACWRRVHGSRNLSVFLGRCERRWARQHGKVFIPSVGPGYDDSRIRFAVCPSSTIDQIEAHPARLTSTCVPLLAHSHLCPPHAGQLMIT